MIPPWLGRTVSLLMEKLFPLKKRHSEMGGKSVTYIGAAHMYGFCEQRIGPYLGVSVHSTTGESRVRQRHHHLSHCLIKICSPRSPDFSHNQSWF